MPNGGWEWQECELEKGSSLGLYRYVVTCKLYRGDMCVGEGVGSCSSLESKYIRNPRDFENTVLKIAKKRSFVDAILTTLGLSDRFTQDAEDIQNNRAVVDDTVPVVMDAEFVPEPEPDPKVERAKEAGLWVQSIGLDRKQFKHIKKVCTERAWFDCILDLKGTVTTPEELMAHFPEPPVTPEVVN